MSTKFTPLARVKFWLGKKWDTAETWLPGFLIAISVIVVIVVSTVRFFGGSAREPAAFVEISDSEIPAESIYADHDDRSERSGRSGNVNAIRQSSTDRPAKDSSVSFIMPIEENLSPTEITSRTGLSGNRARAVFLTPDLLRRPAGKELAMRLSLFEDVQPVIIFKVLSGYEVNAGMHTGRAEDDPNSQVQLTTEDGMVSGLIKYKQKTYRIVSDPERGLHYIVEVKSTF